MEEATYTLLPYVRVKRAFKFAGFYIWPDDEKNWKKYLGIERPKDILGIYLDKKGNKIENMTVITSLNEFSYTKLNELLAFLFFIPSRRSFIPSFADTFSAETYTDNKKGQGGYHSRSDKFVRSIVETKTYLIHQPMETEILNYELRNLEPERFIKMRNILNKYVDSKMIKSLPFYFRTQYRSPNLFPEIEDIQNFCTAFEIYFEVDAVHSTGEEIAKKLSDYFSIAEEADRKDLADWFKELYRVRSDYTHGKEIKRSEMIYKNQRHIDIAKKIYCACIEKQFLPKRGLGKAILSPDKGLLIELFSSERVFNDLISLLTKGWGKSRSGNKNIEYLLNCSDEELAKLFALSIHFYLYVNKNSVDGTHKKRIREALQTFLSMIDIIVKSSNTFDKTKYYVEVIQQLKKLPLYPKNDSELEENYSYLNAPNQYQEIIGDFDKIENFRDEVNFRGIKISDIAFAFTAVYSVYKDWDL